MRTDDSTARDSFRRSKEWTHNATTGETNVETDQRMVAGDAVVDGKLIVHSLSGHERNHFFLNSRSGEEFTDLSALSGLDSPADGRGFALLDYDRDGWQDVVVINANAPMTQLYHNDIARSPAAGGGMIALRFKGGNTGASTSEFGNRDGYGAVVEVTLEGGVTLKREHRCGEGFAAQNSATMIIGIGKGSAAKSVSVRWPSGNQFTIEKVAEGTLLTAHEHRPEGAFIAETYRREMPPVVTTVAAREKFPVSASAEGKVMVFTTTATWCGACLNHLPALAQLGDNGVALFGVPVDVEDDAAKLADYVERRKPPYQMLTDLDTAGKKAVTAFLVRAMHTPDPVLPSSVITDAEGNVLEVLRGIPTLSQIRKWEQKR